MLFLLGVGGRVLGEDTLANFITHSVTCCFCWVLGAGPQRGHVGQLYYAFSNVLFLLGVGGQSSQIKSLDFHVEAERLAHKSRAAVCLGFACGWPKTRYQKHVLRLVPALVVCCFACARDLFAIWHLCLTGFGNRLSKRC